MSVSYDLNYIQCPLCAEDKSKMLFEDNGFFLRKCNNCSLVYVNPRPNKNILNIKYIQNDTFGHEQLDKENKFRNRYLNKFIQDIERYRHKGKMLDIGCGPGYLLKAAEKRGWKTFGVEPSKKFYDIASQIMKLNVVFGELRPNLFKKEEFDVITMINVLGHLDSLSETFGIIGEILQKGGILVLETGNKGQFSRKKEGEKGGDVWGTPAHLCHFSEKSLNFLFDKFGFRIIKKKISAKIERVFSQNMINKIEDHSLFLSKGVRIFNNIVTKTARYFAPFFMTVNSSILIIARKCK